ncbi:MAG: hypothetical protein OEZ21_05755 [Candidatus Bathyarchaeota archaeon]|nr:hypothetical protein [Candidatus Bathyarchaeota archaeon]
MKKAVSMFIALVTVMLALVSISFNVQNVEAASAEDSDYGIEQVNHTVEVMYNGYIFINDTIRITGQASNGFLIGFPYKYGSHVLRCVAYNATDTFQVSLNVPLENRVGFYGVKIIFPQGAPQVFTVGFVLSNDLLNVLEVNYYLLDFPAYPSLTKTVTNCSVVVDLPKDTQDVIVTKDDGTVNASAYLKQNLPAFTYSPATATFSLTGDEIQLFDIKKLRREVRISGTGEIDGSDSYDITSKAPTEINSIEIILPANASNPSAQDQFGREMPASGWADEPTNRYRVSFTLPVESYESTKFTVKYYLPSRVYITQEGFGNLNIAFPLFQHLSYYIEQLSVTFVLPEGAKVGHENASVSGSYNLMRGVFQEAVTVNRQCVFSLDSFDVEIIYEYSLLWLSFRPALWVWALATVGCAIVVIWKRPKAPVLVGVPTVGMRLRVEHIESFVDAYEEKKKILLEIKSLETRVRKGKIPRSRYKVRRKTLETSLNALSRSLAELKEKMRAAGGRYADLMRQLEVAETEISEVEANIESIKARHRRGELSLGAYRKLLADYERRKEKAETTIDGVLIRLREETR